MTNVQKSQWLRLILFMIANLLIVIMAPVSYSIFTGELLALVATLVFFLTFILMYVVTWVFVRWDGGDSVEELGITVDHRLGPHLIFGVIAGTIGAVLVVAIAFFFGGQLRPFDQISGDLIVNQIIITAPTAFFEELVHRGYILSRLENLTGRRVAIFLGSLFFSLLHFTWWAEPGFPIHLAILFQHVSWWGCVIIQLLLVWSKVMGANSISFYVEHVCLSHVSNIPTRGSVATRDFPDRMGNYYDCRISIRALSSLESSCHREKQSVRRVRNSPFPSFILHLLV